MRAIIVGAGIAGPVTAMALQRAGIESLVVEAHPPSDGEVGSYFTVSPNGLQALEVVGAFSIAKGIGFPTRRNVMRNSAGHELGALPLGAPLADGTPALTMKRSRLALALADEAVRRGIRVDFGRRLRSIERDGRGVAARFEDGSTERADLLIGADGVHSIVRRTIDPSALAVATSASRTSAGSRPPGSSPVSSSSRRRGNSRSAVARSSGRTARPTVTSCGSSTHLAQRSAARSGPRRQSRRGRAGWRACSRRTPAPPPH